MSRMFGWDLPPGCTTRDIDRAAGIDGPTTPAEEAQALLDAVMEQLRATAAHDEGVITDLQLASDKITGIIDKWVRRAEEANERSRMHQQLCATYERLALPVIRMAALGTRVGSDALELLTKARAALEEINETYAQI